MAVSGITVICRRNKQTQIAVFDPTKSLVNGRVVTARGSNGSTYRGIVRKVNANGSRGSIRLKCLTIGLRPLTETESGTLAITITNGPLVTPDPTVTYVDDDEACDEPSPVRPKPRKKPKPRAPKKKK